MTTVLTSIAVWAATAPATKPAIPDEEQVTPGTIGFLVTVAVVLVGILLANMAARRVRRVRARAGATESNALPVRVDPYQSREEAEAIMAEREKKQDSTDTKPDSHE